MTLRGVSLTMVVLAAVCAAPLAAQQKLGDYVAQGGYDWVIGRWVATTDQGEKVEVRYDWVCDKCAALAQTAMGGFKYEGMIMLSPTGGEVSEVGADNRGGIWKATWSEDSAGLVRRIELTGPTGEVRKVDVVHARVDADTITIALYPLDNSGSRNGEPWAKLSYKRQTTPVAVASSSEQANRSTDYQTLGDLLSQGGYEWVMGKWLATKEDRTYQLEHKPVLDKHAGLVDVTINDFKFRGLIMYAPARQEIMQIGADNMGRIWKGIWEQGDEGAVYKADITKADGTTQKIQLVYIKGDNDTLKTKEYSVEGSSPTLRDELTFKRQKP
jgi:hypothetical protein